MTDKEKAAVIEKLKAGVRRDLEEAIQGEQFVPTELLQLYLLTLIHDRLERITKQEQ